MKYKKVIAVLLAAAAVLFSVPASALDVLPAEKAASVCRQIEAANAAPLFTIEDFETPLGTGLGGVNAGETIE